MMPATHWCYYKTIHFDWTNASSDEVENYRNLISQCLPALSPAIVDCCSPECICHHNVIDSYADILVNILLDCAHSSISSASRRLAGWNDSPSELRRETSFWHKVSEEAGCPSSGVLINIKTDAKSIGTNMRSIVSNAGRIIWYVTNYHSPSLKRGRVIFGQLSRVLPKYISCGWYQWWE